MDHLELLALHFFEENAARFFFIVLFFGGDLNISCCLCPSMAKPTHNNSLRGG
jgi:hypothetical protein